MDLRQLREQCEAKLRTLDLPAPFDVRTFCHMVAARRGRPVLLRPLASGAGPFGLWAAGPSADVIFYEQETSPLHQAHIILHEVCHLLCGHHPAPVAQPDVARLLFPHVDPETVQRILQRAGYSTDEEREAELLASLIMERATGTPPGASMAPDAEAATILARLEISLEEGTGG